jgi:cell division control protein 6
VLDEIDQLDSRKQSVLYTIFEWPSAPDSKLVLIGIANALDLTDRILPRLQARLDLRPRLLHFAPYTKLEIVNILTERLKQVLRRFDVASTARLGHFTVMTVIVSI